MRWRKLGRVFGGEGQLPWMMSHASVPFARRVDGDLYRIYFTSRDAENRSFVGWVEIDITRPHEIMRYAQEPVLGPGRLGSFDDRGAMLSWIVSHGARDYFYYIGWNTRGTVPFHVSIGVAVGETEAPAAPDGPILERGGSDPLFCSNPCVLKEGDAWRMWYLSGLGWEELRNGKSASYDIRYAQSQDGLNWTRSGKVAIALEGDEYAIARPCVVREDTGYTMWYCARTRERPYLLGASRSTDGIAWEPAPELAVLAPSPDGWDSEMVAYPHVFDHGGDRYMVYCGNGFGRTGFGLAIRD